MAHLRTITTVYYTDATARKIIRTNHSVWTNSAVCRAVGHMQVDKYGARVAEVYDSANGVLHAVLTRSINKMEIVYKRSVKEGM